MTHQWHPRTATGSDDRAQILEVSIGRDTLTLSLPVELADHPDAGQRLVEGLMGGRDLESIEDRVRQIALALGVGVDVVNGASGPLIVLHPPNPDQVDRLRR